ncbi:hypothetical protein [Psychrobacter sp. DAB_AL43B]|uniref:hypothetical protein n=1 Tax=Psychrobacter sp. DAB_AL43B TaxID=1028416 RepID=UPI0009A8C109|nr:hypothetical protein [Psychrobacter sp. DAB_AL43B]SLJ84175.1 hypothetical protein DABAL43B_0977 [Psychrobacter sp. DAB_AL43B]
MNKFHIRLVDFTYSDAYDLDDEKIPEFFIDGRPLINLLGDCRHLGNFDNDLNYQGVLAHNYIWQLLGQVSQPNQLGTNRVVIYRCHCGCDHCGVFSTEIIIRKLTVQWKNIAWEHEEYQTTFDSAITFTFFKPQYFKAIKQYCKASGIVI